MNNESKQKIITYYANNSDQGILIYLLEKGLSFDEHLKDGLVFQSIYKNSFDNAEVFEVLFKNASFENKLIFFIYLLTKEDKNQVVYNEEANIVIVDDIKKMNTKEIGIIKHTIENIDSTHEINKE